MAAENILQTLQRVATLVHRLDELSSDVRELRTTVAARLDKVDTQLSDARERLVRLEALREADRAQAQADLARFATEVERAVLRLGSPSQRSGAGALPEGTETG
jgi:uncharacterized protein involved in exopolysaccharide biosynthesis